MSVHNHVVSRYMRSPATTTHVYSIRAVPHIAGMDFDRLQMPKKVASHFLDERVDLFLSSHSWRAHVRATSGNEAKIFGHLQPIKIHPTYQ